MWQLVAVNVLYVVHTAMIIQIVQVNILQSSSLTIIEYFMLLNL